MGPSNGIHHLAIATADIKQHERASHSEPPVKVDGVC